MIYVIESRGKGNGKADTVILRTFLSEYELAQYVRLNVRRLSDGYKYWKRFDNVEPGEEIENFSE